MGLRLRANTEGLVNMAAQRIAALRAQGWHVEWAPMGGMIDVVAECR